MLYELIPNLKSNRLPTFDCEEFPLLKSVISLSTNNLQGILMWEEFIDMGIQIDYHELETRQRTLSFDDPIKSTQQLEVRNIKPSQHLKQRLYSSENTTHH
jgi:fatty-acyl-CoA synthase